VVELLLGLHAGALELLCAVKLDARVFQLHFEIGDGGLGGFVVGSGGVQGLAGVRIVQGGEQLVFGDVGAFVEEHASDTAGDFRGDGGAAARRDVAAGVEQSFAAAVVGGFLHHHDFHGRFLIPESENGSGKAGQDHEQAEEDSQALPPTTTGAVNVVDAQRTEIVYGRVCRHGHAF